MVQASVAQIGRETKYSEIEALKNLKLMSDTSLNSTLLTCLPPRSDKYSAVSR